jgi:hypothetical protein
MDVPRVAIITRSRLDRLCRTERFWARRDDRGAASLPRVGHRRAGDDARRRRGRRGIDHRENLIEAKLDGKKARAARRRQRLIDVARWRAD